MHKVWEIVAGPHWTRSRGRWEYVADAWIWHVRRGSAERKVTVYQLSGAGARDRDGGGPDVPDDVERAIQSKGRSAVEWHLADADFPREIVIGRWGVVADAA